MMTTTVRSIALVTPNFENNSLGRTWCLWMLARELGISVTVHGVKGDRIWGPLDGSEFAADCVLPDPSDREARLRDGVADADLIIAVKPLPTSFGIARDIADELGRPLVLDIDDPDIEVRTIWLPAWERLARSIASPRYRLLRRLGRLSREYPLMVSNPVLQKMYGGTIVPHVRPLGSVEPQSDTDRPVVRFVGSARGHKGVDVLRAAIAPLSDAGVHLEVTDSTPADAHPWENWLGTTTIEEGARLVSTADIIAIPSLNTSWTPAQLPAKLIDAMMAGRAIVASRTDPIAWALGDAGLSIEPGDVAGLRAAIDRLRDPELRAELGARARARAVAEFSVGAVAPVFSEVIAQAATDSFREGAA